MSLEQIELGNIIRKKRKSLGLTLNDLAGDNISVPTISNIERGVVHNVSDEKITYLLEKLELDERTIKEMKQSDAEERKAFEFELSMINSLIETHVFDKARKQIAELENQAVVNNHPQLAVKIQLAKGQLYRRQEQWERAARAFRKVIQMALDARLDSRTNIEAEAYFHLAKCAFQIDKDCEQALRYSDSAINAFDPDGERMHLEGQIYHDMAVYHYHLEAYTAAYESIHTAQALNEKANDMRVLALSYSLEGTILKKQQMYKRAIPLFQKAIDISATLYPDQALASTLYLNLGDNYYHAKQYEEAKYCYNIVQDLCQKTKDQRMQVLVYCSFGEVYFETKDYEQAKKYADLAFESVKKFDKSIDVLRLLILRANIYLGQRSAQVVDICQEGIDLAEKSKQFEKKKTFHFILAKYYNKIGNEEMFLQETRNMFNAEALIQGR